MARPAVLDDRRPWVLIPVDHVQEVSASKIRLKLLQYFCHKSAALPGSLCRLGVAKAQT
jgi:hypothetical protein